MGAAEKSVGLEGQGVQSSESNRGNPQDSRHPGGSGSAGDPAEQATAELALRVFTGEERWGWEFVQPPEPPAHRDAQNPPVYREPSGTEVRAAQERATTGRNTSGFGCLTVIAGGAAFAAAGVGAAVVVLVLIIALVIATSPNARLRAAQRRLKSDREHAQRDYEARRQAWLHKLAAHRDEQLRHNETLDTWFPIALVSRPSRIDVFGGTGDGWASLLATLGGPLLAGGQSVVVLDFTQQAVALELAGLAARRGITIGHVPMPGALLGTDLREEFTSEELAETLAETLGTIRPPGADIDLHTIDVDLIQTVTDLLEGPVTFARLAAGLRVLLRVYDSDPQ
ncbi:hypothetical protein ACFV17_36740, partial [Streptomyces sp. NPDC059656]